VPARPSLGAAPRFGWPRRARFGWHLAAFLPDNIYDAIQLFKGSRFMQEVMGEEVHAKFAELKLAQAERCPKSLGTLIKPSEVQFHHEVTNQLLWSQF